MVGGAFLCTAVVFSLASGIFHPYYVSLLAPFAAALIGAGVGEMLPAPFGRAEGARALRLIAPLAVAGGAATELIVLGNLSGRLGWATPLVLVLAVVCSVALSLRLAPRLRAAVLGLALAGLLAAPATWAAETLGHATNGTFPAGGPLSAGGGGGPGGPGGRFGPRGGFGAPPAGPVGGVAGAGAFGPPPGGAAGGPGGAGALGGRAGAGGGFGGAGASLTAAVSYVKAHGGGTIAVASQGSAASLIVSSAADVAGIGGFSGRESSVSASWLASEVKAGRLRWVLADTGGAPTLPGDTRTGSQSAISAVTAACRAVKIPTSGGTTTIYDCLGRAAGDSNRVHPQCGLINDAQVCAANTETF